MLHNQMLRSLHLEN